MSASSGLTDNVGQSWENAVRDSYAEGVMTDERAAGHNAFGVKCSLPGYPLVPRNPGLWDVIPLGCRKLSHYAFLERLSPDILSPRGESSDMAK